MKEFLLGLGLAALLGTFYAAGNPLAGSRRQADVVDDVGRERGETIRPRESHRDVFPNVLALLTTPAYVVALQWFRRRNPVPQSRAALRRHGWAVVTWAASLFAAFVCALTAIWITTNVRFLVPVFLLTWGSTAVLGYVTAAGGSRLFAGRLST
jgi:VIT1/CCC1 family predicted Fe2+/Mn2+ transporter